MTLSIQPLPIKPTCYADEVERRHEDEKGEDGTSMDSGVEHRARSEDSGHGERDQAADQIKVLLHLNSP